MFPFDFDTIKRVKPIFYSKKSKIKTVKIEFPPDYDAPQDLIAARRKRRRSQKLSPNRLKISEVVKHDN